MLPEKSDSGSEVASRHDETISHERYDDGSEVQPNPNTTAGQTKCSVCQSSFRRPEHLKRHFRSHTKEKPFECTQCGRHFSRTDTLHRHELSHHTSGTGGKDHTHRITVKTFRACYKCAVARVRCSGSTPCVRCANRSLECQYPTERRPKTKARRDGPQNLSLAKEDVPPANTSARTFSLTVDADVCRSQNEARSPYQPLQHQVGQFQIQLPGTKGSGSSSNDTSDHNPHNPFWSRSEELHNGQRSSESVNLLASGPPDVSGISLHAYAGPDSKHLYPHAEDQGTLPRDRRLRPNDHAKVFQPEVMTLTTNEDLSPGISSQVQTDIASPFLNQTMGSTINWLSNDMLLSTAGERSVAPELSSDPLQWGAFNSSWGRAAWLPPVIPMGHGPNLPDIASQVPSGNPSLGSDMEDHEKRTRIIRQSLLSSSSPSSSHSGSSTIKRSADLYIDGDSARLPKRRRMRSSWHVQPTELSSIVSYAQQPDQPGFSFPAVEGTGRISPANEEAAFNYQVGSTTYDGIYKSFLQLCCKDNFLFSKYESANFPSMETLSLFIRSYFDFFHPVYPIFHTPTFDPNKCHCLVVLAVAAIGCHSADLPGREECTSAFHEFLRRAIAVEKEKFRAEHTPLWLLQALALNHIGLLHGNNERARSYALGSFGELVNLVINEGLLVRSTQATLFSSENSQEQQWALWIEDELRRRTGYLIWLLDCTRTYQFDSHPILSIDDGLAPLPSHETIWEAKSAGAWKQLHDKTLGQENLSLYNALLVIYIEKRLAPGMGEFSHVLLIHALYHRMWEVEDYFRRPLSFWNPTARKQSQESAIPSGSVWLPGIPSYSKWRNSACDCLDILHWTANSAISKAVGFEHPTVLHLHEARIVLLTPFHKIRSLATSLATEKIHWNERQQTLEWHYILQWIKHDQYKARLAIIHAGTCLYHIRRYSTNAFHEPVAAFLAILTLWAYGLCHFQESLETSSSVGPRNRSSNESTIVHLDRPCDDELVQLFVREGQTMRGNITGVGDICGPQGPERILRVGCATLAGVSSWGISKRFIVTFAKLAELTSRQLATAS